VLPPKWKQRKLINTLFKADSKIHPYYVKRERQEQMVSSPPNHDASRLTPPQIAAIFVSLVVVILNSIWFIVSDTAARQLIAMLPRCTDATRAQWNTAQSLMSGIDLVGSIGLMGCIILAIQIGRKVISAPCMTMIQSLAWWSFAVAGVGLVCLLIASLQPLTDTVTAILLLCIIAAATSAAIGVGIGKQPRKAAHPKQAGRSLQRIIFVGAWLILGAYWILRIPAINILISFHCFHFAG
jgi:hypothetical protein